MPAAGVAAHAAFCCVQLTLLKLPLIIIIFIGITTLITRHVLRPSAVKVYVQNASLVQFNLTSTNTLYYNLKLEASINNPKKVIGIYYHEPDAAAYLDQERFEWVPLPSFYQEHRSMSMVHPVFSGQSVLMLCDLISSRFNKEKAEGLFGITIKIHPNMRLKTGYLKTTKVFQKVWCDPLASTTNSSPNGFARTKCDVDYF